MKKVWLSRRKRILPAGHHKSLSLHVVEHHHDEGYFLLIAIPINRTSFLRQAMQLIGNAYARVVIVCRKSGNNHHVLTHAFVIWLIMVCVRKEGNYSRWVARNCLQALTFTEVCSMGSCETSVPLIRLATSASVANALLKQGTIRNARILHPRHIDTTLQYQIERGVRWDERVW